MILPDHIVSFSQHQTLSNRFICRCTVVNEFWSIQSGFTLGGPCVSPWSKILQALRGHVQNRGPEIQVWVTSSLFKRTIHMILFNYDISLHGKNNRFFFFKSYMVILRELKHCKPFNFKTNFIFYGLFVCFFSFLGVK